MNAINRNETRTKEKIVRYLCQSKLKRSFFFSSVRCLFIGRLGAQFKFNLKDNFPHAVTFLRKNKGKITFVKVDFVQNM